MRPETERIVAEVEERGGLPVHVLAMEDLAVAARVTMSPHATDSYVIQVRAGLSYTDYAVAFQCGHVLRSLAVPAGDRVQFASVPSAMAWGERLVRAHLSAAKRPPLPEGVITGFVSQLVGGLLVQLRSIPVGMRIDAWLAEEFPSLGDLQAKAFAAQQQEALGCLSPQVKLTVPDEIIAGSILLNTTYALFCDRVLGAPSYEVPYASAGFGDLGKTLLAIYDEVQGDPASDCVLVDRWAVEIGLGGMYRVPSASVHERGTAVGLASRAAARKPGRAGHGTENRRRATGAGKEDPRTDRAVARNTGEADGDARKSLVGGGGSGAAGRHVRDGSRVGCEFRIARAAGG